MPITLSQIKRKVAAVTLFGEDGDDEALHVEYYLVPQGTIDDTIEIDRIEREASAAEKLRFYASRLNNSVASWDLIDEATDKPIPIEEDAICAKVPFELIMMMLEAIAKDRTDPNSRTSGAQ